MYSLVLGAHSWLRWVVVLLGLYAVIRAVAGWQNRRAWTSGDERTSLLFVASVDVQFVLGLLLYFVYSPYTALAMDDFGNAMRSSGLRFWAVEHPFGAIVGLALLHIGRARAKKAADALRKHRTTAIFFALALIAIAAAVPWPGTPHARPLIPR
jgi:hypothetical protein